MYKELPLLENCFTMKWFGHLTPADGLIDASDIIIYWNELHMERQGRSAISDVTMVYWPHSEIEMYDFDEKHDLRKTAQSYEEHFSRKSGNCHSAEWMKDIPTNQPQKIRIARDEFDGNIKRSPLELAQYFVSVGYLDLADAKRAKFQFERIRECAWARDSEVWFPYMMIRANKHFYNKKRPEESKE